MRNKLNNAGTVSPHSTPNWAELLSTEKTGVSKRKADLWDAWLDDHSWEGSAYYFLTN